MTELKLKTALNKHINPKLVSELLKEYKQAKTAYWINDDLKTLIYSARFSELCIHALECISNPSTVLNMNKIEFGQIFSKLINLPKNTPEEEMMYLAMPQTLKTIFTIRNKKKSTHFKQNELNKIDTDLIITSCNWIMAQFILVPNNQADIYSYLKNRHGL